MLWLWLQVAWRRASGSMLATSATSAVAFLANAISPVPAVRLFGLLLGLLVAVNYVLAVTWLPVSTVAWEKYALDPWCDWMENNKGEGEAGVHKSGPSSDPSAVLASSAHSPIGTVGQPRGFGNNSNQRRGSTRERAAAARTAAATALAAGSTARARLCGVLPPGRVLWQRAFGWIWRARIPLILVLMGISTWGVWLSTRLEPADSLPKLFDDNHNVQKFIDHWTSNFTDGSVFSCPVCLLADSQIALEEQDFGTTDIFSPSGSSNGRSFPGGATTSTTPDPPSTPITGPVVNPIPPPTPPSTPTTPIATPPPVLPVATTPTTPVTPTTPATPTTPTTPATPATPATPTMNGVTAPVSAPPPPPPPPFDEPIDSGSPLNELSIDEQRLREERINTNTIGVSMIWGVLKPERSEGSDAFGSARAGSVQWDSAFELGDETIQRAVLDQVRFKFFTLILLLSLNCQVVKLIQ